MAYMLRHGAEEANNRIEGKESKSHCFVCNSHLKTWNAIEKDLKAWLKCPDGIVEEGLLGLIKLRANATSQSWHPILCQDREDYHDDLIKIDAGGRMLTGLRLEPCKRGQDLYPRPDSYWSIQGNDSNTGDLTKFREGWLPGIPVSSYGYRNSSPIVAHRQCWELLHAIGVLMGIKTTGKRILNAVKHVKDPWLKIICGHPISHSLPSDDTQFPLCLYSEAFQRSLFTRKVDEEVRDRLWYDMQAWIYFAIDRVPIKEAYLMMYSNTNRLCFDTGAFHQDHPSSFDKLPVEIISNIINMTEDIYTARNFAFTCKRGYQIVVPLLNSIAEKQTNTAYRWTLAWTPSEKRIWKEEVASSTALFKMGETSKESIPFPWYHYLRACLHRYNWSMINRKRVWKNAIQIHEHIESKSISM